MDNAKSNRSPNEFSHVEIQNGSRVHGVCTKVVLMEKSIKHWELTHREWHEVRQKLIDDHGQSIVMISWKMRELLGFSVREHFRWDDTHQDWNDRRSVFCIDFYTEAARTYFLLRYT